MPLNSCGEVAVAMWSLGLYRGFRPRRRIVMAYRWQDGVGVCTANLRSWAATGLALAAALALLAGGPGAQAQTYSVLHSFSGGGEGATPMAGLTMSQAGNFYGTAAFGGNLGGDCGSSGCGVIFRLNKQHSVWVVTPLY